MLHVLEEKKKATELVEGDYILRNDDMWRILQTIPVIGGKRLLVIAYWKWNLDIQKQLDFIAPKNEDKFIVFQKVE